MGIKLALQVLEQGIQTPHGGREEAIDELIRESFWMTEGEIARASEWARINPDSGYLLYAMVSELTKRNSGGIVSHRSN